MDYVLIPEQEEILTHDHEQSQRKHKKKKKEYKSEKRKAKKIQSSPKLSILKVGILLQSVSQLFKVRTQNCSLFLPKRFRMAKSDRKSPISTRKTPFSTKVIMASVHMKTTKTHMFDKKDKMQ